MSEINTKIFKPQKWVLDVLNSPKGETIEFEIGSNTYSFFKISDKVPENIDEIIYLYSYSPMDGVNFSGASLTEIAPSVYGIYNVFLIFTNDVEGISKGAYFSDEFYEILEEEGVTELYLILQTTQDFSISKKTIEGEVHPIEEKYSNQFTFEMELVGDKFNENYGEIVPITSFSDLWDACDKGKDIIVKVHNREDYNTAWDGVSCSIYRPNLTINYDPNEQKSYYLLECWNSVRNRSYSLLNFGIISEYLSIGNYCMGGILQSEAFIEYKLKNDNDEYVFYADWGNCFMQ